MYDDTVTVDKACYNKLKEQTTWVSVKDKLPAIGVNVLVYTDCKNTFTASRVVAEAMAEQWARYIEGGV